MAPATRFVSRRTAMRLGGALLFSGCLAGCGQSSMQVIIRLPWREILQVLVALVKLTGELLLKVVVASGVEKMLTATLNPEQMQALKGGAKLLLRTEDGKEF